MKYNGQQKTLLKLRVETQQNNQIDIRNNTERSITNKDIHQIKPSSTNNTRQQHFSDKAFFAYSSPNHQNEKQIKQIKNNPLTLKKQPNQQERALINQLLAENNKLKKLNLDKESLITDLLKKSTSGSLLVSKSNTSEMDRKTLKKKYLISSKQQNEQLISAMGFTFCNTEQQSPQSPDDNLNSNGEKSSKRFPKEFQIFPNRKRFFV